MIALLLALSLVLLNRIMHSHRFPWLRVVRIYWMQSTPRVRQYLLRAPLTFTYLFILSITTWVLQNSSNRVADQLLLERSTNLRQLLRDPVRVLFGSAFWVANSFQLIISIVLFTVIAAKVEHWMGSLRSALIFLLGHVGATLLVGISLWISLDSVVLHSPIANAEDVGSSYGFAALAGIYTYKISKKFRFLYSFTIFFFASLDFLFEPNFTSWGHLIGLGIGFLSYFLIPRKLRRRISRKRKFVVARQRRATFFDSESRDVAVIGFGAMGLAITTNLLRHHRKVELWHSSSEVIGDVESEGALVVGNLSDVKASLLFILLPDIESIYEALDNGLQATLRQGDFLIIMGRVPPSALRRLGSELAPSGIRVIEAVLSRGDFEVGENSSTLLIGGQEQDFRELFSLLSKISKNVHYVGELGAGTIANACQQIVKCANLLALTESISLAKVCNLRFDVFSELLVNNSAEMKFLKIYGEEFLPEIGNFSDGIEEIIQELEFALEIGLEYGSSAPLTRKVLNMLMEGKKGS